ncbi:MAG: hypothetical protein ACLQVI_20330 [Polyangiaceae bacterium]|jgi:hypothetical protein
MGLDDLSKRLADRERLGLDAALADKLKIPSEDVVRGQLMAMSDDDRGPISVSLLAIYVVDDTDVWGDGEIYWYTVPVLVDAAGNARWSPVSGLPSGAPPHKCGSLEWMTNISLAEPPIVAVVPPDDDIAACVVRLAIYDDDKAPADLRTALARGYEALSACAREGLPGAQQVVLPVRDAIHKSLKAEDDDILIDEDVTLRRGAKERFSVGLIGSIVNAKVRVYYLVKDEMRTETIGPLMLHKGQMERVQFKSKLARGGRIALFARGADVGSDVFGDLTTDMPFAGKVLDARLAETLGGGFLLRGTGAAKAIAYYTPP